MCGVAGIELGEDLPGRESSPRSYELSLIPGKCYGKSQPPNRGFSSQLGASTNLFPGLVQGRSRKVHPNLTRLPVVRAARVFHSLVPVLRGEGRGEGLIPREDHPWRENTRRG